MSLSLRFCWNLTSDLFKHGSQVMNFKKNTGEQTLYEIQCSFLIAVPKHVPVKFGHRFKNLRLIISVLFSRLHKGMYYSRAFRRGYALISVKPAGGWRQGIG